VWLPVGVGIAGLYLGGLQLWPAILIGDVLADQHVSLPLGVVAAQTAGNVLEIIVGVVLLRHLVARRGNEETLQGVGAPRWRWPPPPPSAPPSGSPRRVPVA